LVPKNPAAPKAKAPIAITKANMTVYFFMR
jgi:hypothetical protein